MKTKKKAVARKPKLEPWRAELARIVRFLNKNNDQSESLWSVLTALRGPDSNDWDEKLPTTCVIRSVIGLRQDFDMATVEPETERNAGIRANIKSGHFRRHAVDAFNTLGLDWDALNK